MKRKAPDPVQPTVKRYRETVEHRTGFFFAVVYSWPPNESIKQLVSCNLDEVTRFVTDGLSWPYHSLCYGMLAKMQLVRGDAHGNVTFIGPQINVLDHVRVHVTNGAQPPIVLGSRTGQETSSCWSDLLPWRKSIGLGHDNDTDVLWDDDSRVQMETMKEYCTWTMELASQLTAARLSANLIRLVREYAAPGLLFELNLARDLPSTVPRRLDPHMNLLNNQLHVEHSTYDLSMSDAVNKISFKFEFGVTDIC